MTTPRDNQFHRDKSFSKGDAPRPGGEADEALEGSGEMERPLVVDGLTLPDTDRHGTRGPAGPRSAATGQPGSGPNQARPETVDEEVAGRFLNPLPERHRPKGDDPEGMLADWNRGEGRP